MPKKSHVQSAQTQTNTTPKQNDNVVYQAGLDSPEYKAFEAAHAARVEAKLRQSQYGVTHWHGVDKQHPDYQQAVFVEEVHHIAAGIALILSIKEQADLDRTFIADSDEPENEAAPLFSMNDEAVLLRFARVAASRLVVDCECTMEWLSERSQGGAHG